MRSEIMSSNGVAVGAIELNDQVFASSVSEGSIYYTLKNQLANARQGTASSKGRSDVNYSNRKPWRQKGTGRARAGSKRSPVWVGGGVVFGPHPRDYSYTIPRKMRRLAYCSVLTKRLQDKKLRFIDFNEQLPHAKTKEFNERILAFNEHKSSTVLIISSNNAGLKRVARNIPWLSVFSFDKLEMKSLLYCKLLLITKDAAQKLNTFLYRAEKEKKHAEIS